MENLLKELYLFQKEYPKAHVGGSIGLFLHGVDLKRDLSNSDIDITIPEFAVPFRPECTEKSGLDFDYQFTVDKIKFDIRINPEPTFIKIWYGGKCFKVSMLENILFWKEKYAKKGSNKHKEDLEVIKTGIRNFAPVSQFVDDLPF